jgi:hypothetical protein
VVRGRDPEELATTVIELEAALRAAGVANVTHLDSV